MKSMTTRVELAPRTRGALIGLAVVGAIMAAAGGVVAPDRMWASWLLVAYYALGLGLAGLCFVALAWADVHSQNRPASDARGTKCTQPVRH